MTQLAVYLICMGLVVLGAMAFIAALNIPSRIRMVVGCLAACVPVAAGIWTFRSAALQVSDFGPLLRNASREIRQLVENLKQLREIHHSLDNLWQGKEPPPRRSYRRSSY